MTYADILTKPSEQKNPATLGFGAMRLPDVNETTKMVDAYLEAGFNYFDTAYIYGGSEEKLKKALTTRHTRDSYMIADKMPPWSVRNKKDCERLFTEMQKRLGLDYIDFMLVHSLDDGNERNAVNADIYGWAAEEKKKGNVRHVGFSFHGSPELLEKCFINHPEMEFVQLQINYIDVLRGQAGLLQEIAIKHDKPIIIMEPVKGGSLANLPKAAEALMKTHAPDKSIASWALRYTAQAAGATCVLSGMSDIKQTLDNIQTFNPPIPLTEDEMVIIKAALLEISKISNVPCTACKYCLADCPQKIDIPSCFNLYNELKRGGTGWNLTNLYNAILRENRADSCTACGICVARCPQGIDIPAAFKDVVKAFR
jgi:hypothetical protein